MGYLIHEAGPLLSRPSSRDGAASDRLWLHEPAEQLVDWTSNSRSTPTPASEGAYIAETWETIYKDALYVSISNNDFGFVVDDVFRVVTIRSTFDTDKTLNSLTIPEGFEWVGIPSLPMTIAAQTEYQLTIKATTDGPPTLSGGTITLTFAHETLYITGLLAIRSVVLPFRPMNDLNEELEWLTVIHQKISGTEQRSGVRRYPRQIFTAQINTDQGVEESKLNNFLVYWQGKSILFPVWSEPMVITADVSAGASVLAVDETRYADIRDGGLVAIAQGNSVTEVVEVVSHTTTSITINGTLQNGFSVGDEVLPARVCTVDKKISGSRWPINIARTDFILTSIDNVTDIEDSSAFSTLESKVFLDEPNEMGDTTPVTHFIDTVDIDAMTGRQSKIQVWPYGRKGFEKGWSTLDRQSLWEKRQLLYFLGGRRVSFYYPTFSADMNPLSTLGAGAVTMDITNVGFSSYVQGNNPYSKLRIVKTDGSTIVRSITDVDNVDEDTEEITVNSAWGEEVLTTAISRVELIQLCRIDTDRIRIEHLEGNGQAKIFFPIVNTIT